MVEYWNRYSFSPSKKMYYGIDEISYYLPSLNGLLYTLSSENNEIFEIKLVFKSIFF